MKKAKLKLQRRKLHYIVTSLLSLLFADGRKYINGYTREAIQEMLRDRKYKNICAIMQPLVHQ